MAGPVTSSGSSMHLLKISIKQRELLIRKIGEEEWTKVHAFSAPLKEVDYYKNPGNKEHDIEPYWAYKFIFEVLDEGEWQGDWKLELRNNHRLIDNFINSLAGEDLTIPGKEIYFRVYENQKGYPAIYMSYDGGDNRMNWKVPLEELPNPVDTVDFDEQGNIIKDWTPVREFWKDIFIKDVYPAVNGKPYQAASDTDLVRKYIANSQKIFDSTSLDNFAANWKKMATFMATKFQVDSDREEIMKMWQEKYQMLKGKGYLTLDGGISETKEEPKADTLPTDDDFGDLPF